MARSLVALVLLSSSLALAETPTPEFDLEAVLGNSSCSIGASHLQCGLVKLDDGGCNASCDSESQYPRPRCIPAHCEANFPVASQCGCVRM